MSNRAWNLAIASLFVILAIMLTQFAVTSKRIHKLVDTLITAPEGAAVTRHVVLISQEADNPFWRSIESGAREAAAAYGINLEYTGPFRMNPEEQIKLLQKMLAAKADAILVQGVNDPRYRLLIEQAVQQGIPVVTVDTDEPDSRRLSYVGTDNVEAGRRMGELVARTAGSAAGGSIGVLIGNERAENQRLRLAGFRSVIGSYPQLKIVDVRSSNISRLQAASQAEEILKRHPDVRYMVGFSSLDGIGILEAAERTGTSGIRIFAFDDLAETTEAIARCAIEATIVQQPRQMGYNAIKLVNEHFKGNSTVQDYYTPIEVRERKNAGSAEAGGCRR